MNEKAIEAAAQICRDKYCELLPGKRRWSELTDQERYVDVEAADALSRTAGQEWRDISSAPKDGSEVLLAVKMRANIPNCRLVGHWMPGGHCIDDHPPIDAGWYFWNGCMFDKASEPTGWMPLPAPPAEPIVAEQRPGGEPSEH